MARKVTAALRQQGYLHEVLGSVLWSRGLVSPQQIQSLSWHTGKKEGLFWKTGFLNPCLYWYLMSLRSRSYLRDLKNPIC